MQAVARVHPYASCKGCGKTREQEGSRLSATGLCLDCAEKRRSENLAQLAAREGPYYDHWLRRLHLSTVRKLVATGGVPLDEANQGR